MSKKDTVILSESEIDGEFLDVAIKQSIRDIQQGLCEVERHLLNMIDNDEIDGQLWLASHICNVELLNLVKELITICKEIKPSAKSLKIARTIIEKTVEHHEKLNQ